ncbi:adenylate/guanylate cyclase domain-containing protein [Synechococcus sp. PCC 7502]|uniref:adenylate/guanylate cyclase domain-containing protein n=1 Tax=Synechococcus sp. PCC 7502 TaxID=1173263 RepID=UPI001438C3D3|nr:adenylate/guanylate cyclase domain-containing protein [Synechococcus sp. PCC 7502]
MPLIKIQPDEEVFEIGRNQTVLQASLDAGIAHTHACGGRARCSTCRILITEGLEYCAPRNPLEETLAQKLGFPQDIRLACQTKVAADIAMRRLVLDIEDEHLASDQVKFGKIGEEKFFAILFSDIRGFTKLSETMLPYDVIYILNRYFQAMGEVVDLHDGMINNFMGDGFMALFGINDPDRAAENSVRAALGMIEALEQLNSRIELLFANPLKVGIGIHYGTVILGAVGTRQQKNITAIGDAVNFASRIESANKEFGTTILVSTDIYQLVRNQVTISSTPKEAKIRGKTGTYCLYEIVDILPDLSVNNHNSNSVNLSDHNYINLNKKPNNQFYKIWQLLQTKIF